MQNDELTCPICYRDFDNDDDLNYHYGMIHDPSLFERQYDQ